MRRVNERITAYTIRTGIGYFIPVNWIRLYIFMGDSIMRLLGLIALLGLVSCDSGIFEQDLRLEEGETVYLTQKLYLLQNEDLYEEETPKYKYYCKKLTLTALRASKLNSELNILYDYGSEDVVLQQRSVKELILIRIYDNIFEGTTNALVDFVTTSGCETKSAELRNRAEKELRGLE